MRIAAVLLLLFIPFATIFYFLQAEVSLYKQTGNYRISYLTVSGLFIPCFICRTLLLPG